MGVNDALVPALDEEPNFRFGAAVAQENSSLAGERGFRRGEEFLHGGQGFQGRLFADALEAYPYNRA